MGLELKVPQVFEPGARVQWEGVGIRRVLTEIRGGYWFGVDAHGRDVKLCLAHDVPGYLRVIAPAPRAGQRWVDPDSTATISSDGGTFEAAIAGGGWCRGSADFVAQWLLEHGYSYAGEADAAPETLRASEAVPSASASARTPWTREDSRRCVAAYMRSVEAEPFGRAIAHVLGAVAEMDPLVDEGQVLGLIAGLRAWEKRRSDVAPGVRRLRDEQRAACAEAARAAHAAVCSEQSMPVDRAVSGEVVRLGDIYERARASC